MNSAGAREEQRDPKRLRVLFVPDSIYWVLGTNARATAAHNAWIEATILSGPVLERLVGDLGFFDRFDLVHFVCPYASKRWLPLLDGKLPVVTSHHHVTDWNAISHNLRGDAIVTGSSQWVEDIVARGAARENVVSVPYGVDTNLFTPVSKASTHAVRKQLGLGSAGPVVGFFAKRGSNDDDRKGIDVFEEAARLLHAKLPESAVLVVGPGWQDLIENLRSAGIRCAWQPFLEDLQDVARLYHALDFYWVTARVEGGPVPLLEAMSSSVCSLTTPVGLAREIVDAGVNALLLPMNDPSAFATETVRLWMDSPKRLAIAACGRETIVRQMHTGTTLQGVWDAYRRAFENFAAKTSSVSLPPALSSKQKYREQAGDNIPLAALNQRERRRAAMLEALEWSENLVLYQEQHSAALRLIAKAWMRNPFSPEPARVFLRRFLPRPVVDRIVRAKQATERTARSKLLQWAGKS